MTSPSSTTSDPLSADEIPLWPEIEPYKTDFLQVSEIHNIYYELCGTPDRQPVFVLHGGPGSGCSPYMRRFFNPDKFLIVLPDQRGAGKSTPAAETKQNTTQHLVQDIEQLRKHLNLNKIILFGGSWGTTLALAYAQTYPDNVSAMILRGLFTATQQEIDHFYHGGVSAFFPDVYEYLINSLPDPDQHPLPQYLLSLIEDPDPDLRSKYSRLWSYYEMKVCGLYMSDLDVEKKLEHMNTYAFARIENHYMANNCFLQPNQLLNDAHTIAHIPTVIVNGRYDVICPPGNAWRLKQKLPKARLIFAEAGGHWMGEKPVEKELLKAMREFEK